MCKMFIRPHILSPKYEVACHGQQCNDDQRGKCKVHNIGDHQVKSTFGREGTTVNLSRVPSQASSSHGSEWTYNVPGITDSRGWKPIACMRCIISMRRTTPCGKCFCQRTELDTPHAEEIIGMHRVMRRLPVRKYNNMLEWFTLHTWST